MLDGRLCAEIRDRSDDQGVTVTLDPLGVLRSDEPE